MSRAVRLLAFLLLLIFSQAALAQRHGLRVDTGRFPDVVLRFELPLEKVKNDLTVADFALEENEVPVDGFHVRSLEPVAVCLIVERGQAMASTMADLKATARRVLIAAGIGAKVEVIAFGDEPKRVVNFTRDRAVLEKGIQDLVAGGGSSLLAALRMGIADLKATPALHQLVIVCTGGRERLPSGGERRLDIQSPEVRDLVRSAQAPLCFIGFGASPNLPLMTSIARSTAGRFFYAPSAQELVPLFGDVASMVDVSLEFRSVKPISDGTLRKVSLTFRLELFRGARDLYYQAPGERVHAVVGSSAPSPIETRSAVSPDSTEASDPLVSSEASGPGTVRGHPPTESVGSAPVGPAHPVPHLDGLMPPRPTPAAAEPSESTELGPPPEPAPSLGPSPQTGP